MLSALQVVMVYIQINITFTTAYCWFGVRQLKNYRDKLIIIYVHQFTYFSMHPCTPVSSCGLLIFDGFATNKYTWSNL